MEINTKPVAVPREWLKWVAVALISMMIAALIGRCSYMQADAPRNEVVRSVAALDPACRPIARSLARSRMMHEKRPLSRSDLEAATTGLENCAKMSDQLNGLDEAIGG